MGGNTSRTRKLTVENDDPTSVIKVSEDVVQRLRGSNKLRGSSYVQNYTGSTQNIQENLSYLNEPSLTTIQLRQAHIEDLKKNDEYWANRIKAMEANHKTINQVLEQEYQKAIDEFPTRQIHENLKYMPPCQDSKQAVMKCYRKYPKEPMKCSKIILSFQECVDLKRTRLIENRG